MSNSREVPQAPSLANRLTALPDIAVALIIAVLVIGVFMLLDPLADVPMNDDFSWARSAEMLARTGRVVYNGWANPILLPHIVVGAAIIRIFGFSHIALGAFGIVSGAAYAAIAYLLARAVGVPRALSLFAVALLTLNPVFLGVTPSFMSDIPTSCLFLGSILVFIRALRPFEELKQYRLDPMLLATATALAYLAGANRQIFWAAAAIAFGIAWPSITPQDRRNRLVPAVGILLMGGVLTSIWFTRQPFNVPVDFLTAEYFWFVHREFFFYFPFRMFEITGLALLPITLPATVALLSGVDRASWRSGRIFLFCFVGLIPIFCLCTQPATASFFIQGRFGMADYGQYLTYHGIQVGGPNGYLERPIVIPPLAAHLLDLFGSMGIGLCLYVLSRRSISTPMLILVGGSLAQLILPLPWICGGGACDRYLPAIVPGLLLAAMQPLLQIDPNDRKAPALPLLGMPLAVLYAFGGVTFAVEYFGYTQTRSQLYHRLVSAGVPPERIDAGVENCGDTQIAIDGYINNDRIVNPPTAYRSSLRGNCMFMPMYFPAIDAQFLISTSRIPDIRRAQTRDHLIVDPEVITKADYFSPLGPPSRTMYVFHVRKVR